MFSRDGLLRVETTTLLPDGSLATLTLRARGDLYSVSDDAAGRSVLTALGIATLTPADARRGSEMAETLGVMFTEGRFQLDQIGLDQIPAAISYVAEACRRWTDATLDARQRRRENEMAGRAIERLRAFFPNSHIDIERELPGASRKLHRFDAVVALPRERFALFEILVPAASSVAAAHLKFHDLKQAHPDWPREVLVEDVAEWAEEDLAVMRQVTTGIHGVQTSWGDFKKLAA